ncbi:hypothetical protein GQF61_17320 [Sphingobacterium sp. DK4209]|uniref:Uncharacterized protein n=1 Tax=Sphingobacterium zhuxiongii TaxID=2662364 RepID=A0A5Q0Q9C7_9SPHI|nr:MULTISPECIES: hypothetical protein [unclassified Sphingobacterium]MVZ67609.1 hypothetical protein [Sphingobacterium sp. DK4209]QGA26697.1 hypothetical protein GFH32_10320 [Sphingobacterium sp. dk4302]
MRIIFLAMSFGLLLSLSSCEKTDNDIDEGGIDSYYVLYQISGNGTYGRFSDWTVTTPGSLYKNNGYQTRSWSQTYGPVKAGFRCDVNIGNYISGAPRIIISVSKNDEPFAIKVSTTGRSASYTIQ